jgi:hypothetical protein
MTSSDEDRGRRRRLGAENRGWSNTGRALGDRTIKRSSDAVYSLHRTQGDEEHRFIGLALKPKSTVCQSFGLKTIGSDFLV